MISQELELIATVAELLPKAVTPVEDRVVNLPVEAVELPIATLSNVEVAMPPVGVKTPVDCKVVNLPVDGVEAPIAMLSNVEVAFSI